MSFITLFLRPATAQRFVIEGIRSIKDLKDNIAILNNHQKIGLKYERALV